MHQKVLDIYKLVSLSLLLLLAPLGTIAQVDSDEQVIREEIKGLIGKYVYLISQIRPDTAPDPARPFVQLFRNPRVEIYDDLDPNPSSATISVRDYGEKIKILYPDGIYCRIDVDNLKIGQEQRESDTRMTRTVTAKRTMETYNDGVVGSKVEKLSFIIGYEQIDGEYRNFSIYEISRIIRHESKIILFVSPSWSRLSNENLEEDPRFDIEWKLSGRMGLNYQYSINKSWSLGTGIHLAQYNHSLSLDKLDPLKNRDPNLVNVRWYGELTYLEIPVYAVYNLHLNDKLSLEFSGGGVGSFKTFESIVNEGENFHSREILSGVVSDPFNYENISEMNMGIEFDLGLEYNISKNFGLILKTGFKQGLISIEEELDSEYPYSIYQGQYNPMFYKSGSSVLSQDFTVKFGLTYKIGGKKY